MGAAASHRRDVEEVGPEPGGGQGKAAGQGNLLAVRQQDVSAGGKRLPVLLVDQHLGLNLDQRLGVPATGRRQSTIYFYLPSGVTLRNKTHSTLQVAAWKDSPLQIGITDRTVRRYRQSVYIQSCCSKGCNQGTLSLHVAQACLNSWQAGSTSHPCQASFHLVNLTECRQSYHVYVASAKLERSRDFWKLCFSPA